MCRSIKTLYNFDPPATDKEIEAASLQFVRKLSGMTHPSVANQDAFEAAIEEISAAATRLLTTLRTNAQPRTRETEAERARSRSADRFARPIA